VLVSGTRGRRFKSSQARTRLFGNLSRYVVRIGGGLRVRRNLQSIYVEKGQALYTALLRVDARLYKPGDDDPVAVGQFAT